MTTIDRGMRQSGQVAGTRRSSVVGKVPSTSRPLIEMEDLAAVGRRRLAQGDETAEAHHGDVRRQAEDVVEVVADDQLGETTIGEPFDEATDPALLLQAERRHRLVHHQHDRALVDGPGDRHTLALSARQGAHLAANVGDVDPATRRARRQRSDASRRGRASAPGPTSSPARGRGTGSRRRCGDRRGRDPGTRWRCPPPGPTQGSRTGPPRHAGRGGRDRAGRHHTAS